MNNATTTLIWRTLRTMAIEGNRYNKDNRFQDIAKELIKTIPWYSWPKSKAGELMYDSVLCLAYYSQRTIDAWAQKHPDCYYNVTSPRNTEPWCWIAMWASMKRLDYYLEN